MYLHDSDAHMKEAVHSLLRARGFEGKSVAAEIGVGLSRFPLYFGPMSFSYFTKANNSSGARRFDGCC